MSHHKISLFSAVVVRIAAIASALLLVESFEAATFTWNGGSPNNNTTTAANWVGNAAPVADSDIIWAGTTRLAPNVNTGGSLATLTFDNTAGAFVIGGAAVTLSNGITNNSANVQTINVPITLTLAQSINAASGSLAFGGTFANGGFLLTATGSHDTSISNVLSGTGGLTKTSTGTLTLSGANTYSGGTTINGGIVAINSGSSLGASGVAATINAGTLESTATFSSTRNFTLGSAASTIMVDPAQTFTIGNVVSGTGGLIKTGAGTLTLSGGNTYTGATTVSAGNLKAGVASVTNTSGALGNNSALTLTNTAGVALDITGFNTQIGSLTGGGATGGNVTLGAATLTTGGDNTSPAAYAGVISGTGSVTKIGTGTQTLSGTNTYSGITTIDGGTIIVNSASSLGSGALTINAGTLEIANGFTTARNITLGNVGSTVHVDPSQTYISTGVISGSGNLHKLGIGTMVLSGVNTYTGATDVDAGTLQIGASERIANTSDLTVSGTFDLQTFSETLAGVMLSGGSITGSGAGILTGSSYILQSGITSAILAGSGTVTKNTAGTVTLSGANTLSGALTVSAGTLTLATTSGSALGSISTTMVSAGGTLMLGANDQINNNATMSLGGGTFAKGNFSEGTTSSVGLGALTLTTTGSIIDFGTGTVGVLSLASFNPGGNTLVIDNWTGTANTLGTGSTDRLIFDSDQTTNLNKFNFIGFAPGAVEFALTGTFFEIAPLSAVPEPSTWYAAALAAAFIAFQMRHRVGAAIRTLIQRLTRSSPIFARMTWPRAKYFYMRGNC